MARTKRAAIFKKTKESANFILGAEQRYAVPPEVEQTIEQMVIHLRTNSNTRIQFTAVQLLYFNIKRITENHLRRAPWVKRGISAPEVI